MEKILLLMGATVFTGIASAQTLSPQVIASSGDRYSNGSTVIEFTIGEVLTSTLTAGGNTLTQGFHQPEIHYASLENYADEVAFVLYPNPTQQFVTITSDNTNDMKVHVYDAAGRAIMVSPVFQQEVTLDLQNLATGNYVLMVSTGADQPLHSYTITKQSAY